MITDERPFAASSLPDLRDRPLAVLADPTAAILDEAIRRVIPQGLPPSETPFNSAI